MNSGQRVEFKELLERLYAGFNMPISEVRVSAYWEGLAKMSLGTFAACVEYALGEHGPDRIPSSSAIWKISHLVRSRNPAPYVAPPIEQQSRALMLVNGLFLKYLLRRRMTEGFKGDVDISGRRRECLALIQWLESWTPAELKTEAAEIQRMFDQAMAKVTDVAA